MKKVTKGAKAAKAKAVQAKGKKVVKMSRFTINCSQPAADSILDPASLEKFLHDRIKVEGKTSNLGNAITITRDNAKVIVSTKIPLSKRYLKYLTKKFLKKNQLKDWMHAVATTKNTYEIKYYRIDNEDEAEEEAPAAE